LKPFTKYFPFVIQMKVVDTETGRVSYDPATPVELLIAVPSEPLGSTRIYQLLRTLFIRHDESHFTSAARGQTHYFNLHMDLGLVFCPKRKGESRKLRIVGDPSEEERATGITAQEWFTGLKNETFSDGAKLQHFAVIYTIGRRVEESGLLRNGWPLPPLPLEGPAFAAPALADPALAVPAIAAPAPVVPAPLDPSMEVEENDDEDLGFFEHSESEDDFPPFTLD
jgi:hypothetical protein